MSLRPNAADSLHLCVVAGTVFWVGRSKGECWVMRIDVERQEDWAEVEALYDTAFGPGRKALSSYRLREGVAPVPELGLVVKERDTILAAIRYWPACIDLFEVLLLGPIAVHPTSQGEGLGAWLMTESLHRAERLGWARVLLVGDAPYYRRFGFEVLRNVQMPPPTNPNRILGRALQAGAWDNIEGVVHRSDTPCS